MIKPEDLSNTIKKIPAGGIDVMNYKYFIHHDCSFYPCHNLTDWKSCLFCWCPIYLLDCGGDFVIRNGIKDCSGCIIPHIEEGYDYILETIKSMIYQKTA